MWGFLFIGPVPDPPVIDEGAARAQRAWRRSMGISDDDPCFGENPSILTPLRPPRLMGDLEP
jgi:hypothetical protein